MSGVQKRDHILERTAITDRFSHPILDSPESFLLVASLGEPDFAQRPLAITSAYIVNLDTNIIGGTHVDGLRRVESASQLALAHDSW